MASGGLKVLKGGRAQTLPVGSTIAVLDLGSTKTTCIIATVDSLPQSGALGLLRSLRVRGHGTTVSRGISNGVVANLEEAERCIRIAVDMAERSARFRVHDIHVNVSGGKPQTLVGTAHVKIADGTVSARDIENCTAAAVAKLGVGRRHVLHIVPMAHAVDGVESDDAPLGMHGEVLSVEVGVVIVEPATFRNLGKAVAHAHLTPKSFSLSPLAAGRGVLLPDEQSLGTVVIDMGGASTDFAVFRKGRFVYSDSIAVGGTHVTHDIAHGLATTIAHAERLKTMFGSVMKFGNDDRDMLAVPLLGERGVDSIQHVPKSQLTAIIRPRIEETLELVREKLVASNTIAGISRVVLTGGASELQGLRDYVAELLGCVVRIGKPSGLQGLPEHAQTGALAVSAGLLTLAFAPEKMLVMAEAARAALAHANMGYVRRMGLWLKEAL